MTVPSPIYRSSMPRGASLRIVFCRRCGHATGIPGAAYCDECRPHRLSDALLSAQDIERINALAAEETAL